MSAAFEDALVTGYESLIDQMATIRRTVMCWPRGIARSRRHRARCNDSAAHASGWAPIPPWSPGSLLSLVELQVMLAERRVQVLDRVAEGDPGRGPRMSVEEIDELRLVGLPGLP